MQVRESSPSGRSGSRKRPTRRAGSGEKMGDQALYVECPWEAWCYLGKGPPAGITQGCVRHRQDAHAQSCLGSISSARSLLQNLQVPNGTSDSPCHEHHHQHHWHQLESQGEKGDPWSPKETSPPAWHRGLSGDGSCNHCFLKAKVLPALRKDPSPPSIVRARQLDIRLCPSYLSVSCLVQLGPGQKRVDAMRRGRPLKGLGRWGNWPLLAASCFPACLVIP